MRESAHGAVTELTVEREVIETTAREKFAVVHFYHREFQRCKIMDRHLEVSAATSEARYTITHICGGTGRTSLQTPLLGSCGISWAVHLS